MDSAARNIVVAGKPKNVKSSERLRNLLVAGALGLAALNCGEADSVSKKSTDAPVPAGASVSASLSAKPDQKSLINPFEETVRGDAMADDKVYFVGWQQTVENEFTGKKGEEYFVVEVTKDQAKTMQGIQKEFQALDKQIEDVESTRLGVLSQIDRIGKGRKSKELTPEEQQKVQELDKMALGVGDIQILSNHNKRVDLLFQIDHIKKHLTPQEQKKSQELEKKVIELDGNYVELAHKRHEVESRWQKVALGHPEGETKPIPGGAKLEGRILTSAELRRLDPAIKIEAPDKRQPQKQ